MVKNEIKNLIKIEDQLFTLEMLEKINQGQEVNVSICPDTVGKKLLWQNKCAFIFDVCVKGNEQYNAVSVIRDLLKKYHSEGHWTRNAVEPVVMFSKCVQPSSKKPK